MDRPERIATATKPIRWAAAAVWRGLRRWPKTSFLVLTPVVLLVVPVQPFFPSCRTESYDSRYIFRYMSSEYRSLLKYAFDQFRVYYWDIGGLMFVRVLPFLDGDRYLDQGDAIMNAERGVAGMLVSEQYDGEMIDGRFYRIPPFLKELVESHRSDDPSMDRPYIRCDVMPYIVTMEPPP